MRRGVEILMMRSGIGSCCEVVVQFKVVFLMHCVRSFVLSQFCLPLARLMTCNDFR
jgi:hypothetical protein